MVSVHLSVRPGVDLGFRTSTDGQDQVLKSKSLDGRGGRRRRMATATILSRCDQRWRRGGIRWRTNPVSRTSFLRISISFLPGLGSLFLPVSAVALSGFPLQIRMCQDLGCLLEIQGYRQRKREGMCEDLGWVEIHREKERHTHTQCVRACVNILDGWKFTERERDGYRVTFWRAWV